MDDFDQAQRLEERQREDALAALALSMGGDGRKTCLACGEEIALERRMAVPNAVRCVECQQRVERYCKLRAR
ncbi:TraR/DksA C4-type zinc finger protein [Ancylobacter sp. G4_0304]|uniref:TraR/DksA C4-type zinc finger protein n=1 Tax=Ancylobacter sp. G4_0304 TaxID=3114289 RepID=UPI0039C704D9